MLGEGTDHGQRHTASFEWWSFVKRHLPPSEVYLTPPLRALALYYAAATGDREHVAARSPSSPAGPDGLDGAAQVPNRSRQEEILVSMCDSAKELSLVGVHPTVL